MKRKDWKIKKLKKDIYGRIYRKSRNNFFLRKLFLRKNSVLFRKNYIVQFFFLKKFIKCFYFKKHFIFNNLYVNKNFNYLTVFPDFFYKKKVLSEDIIFKKIMFENDLNFFFKKIDKCGSIIIFDNNQKINIYEKIKNNFIKEDNKNYVVSLKNKDTFFYGNFHESNDLTNSFNFFLNFNVFLNYNLEIYKILITLYIFKLQ